MKILMLHNFYRYRGGEDLYFLSLNKLLKKRGHKIIPFTKDSRDLNKNISMLKIKTTYQMYKNYEIEKDLTSVIKKSKPDIAHFHNIFPLIGPSAYTVCKNFNIPIIQRISNFRFVCPKGTLFRENTICELCVKKNFSWPSILYRCYQNSYAASFAFSTSQLYHRWKQTFNFIDMYIFQAEFIRNYCVENLNIPIKKTVVIPHFVPEFKIEKLPKEENNYYLFVGRLSEEKGIIPLLNVFTSLPNKKLIVIGDGPLKSEVNTYKKYKNIIIKNFLDRKRIFSYMTNAIFTIIPSMWYETGPLVLMESLYCGTPVIVPKFGVFETSVINGKTGVFFEKNNFLDLKEKILSIRSNETAVKTMRKFARKEFEDKYTSNRHYDLLIKLYKNVLKNHES